MKRKPNPPSPEVVANAVRNHWASQVIATCLRNAALLNLVPYGETDLQRLPANVRDITIRKCRELRDEATRSELEFGQRREQIERFVNTELWNALKPFGLRDLPIPPSRQEALL